MSEIEQKDVDLQDPLQFFEVLVGHAYDAACVRDGYEVPEEDWPQAEEALPGSAEEQNVQPIVCTLEG